MKTSCSKEKFRFAIRKTNSIRCFGHSPQLPTASMRRGKGIGFKNSHTKHRVRLTPLWSLDI